MSIELSSIGSVFFTLLVYLIGVFLFKRTKSFFLFSPILVGIVLGVLFLYYAHIPYSEYMKGGSIITFFLTPATIMYAIPLFNRLDAFKKNFVPIILIFIIGSIYTVFLNYLVAKMTGSTLEVQKSVLTKSITAAMALPVTEGIGGIKAVSMLMINLTAIVGFSLGPWILKVTRITNPIAQGLAMGTASHALGAVKAIEMGEVQGAMAGLALTVNGILTAVTAPIIAKLIGLI